MLWLWSEPITVTTEGGEDLSLLVLESGNGNWKQDESIIFALSVLLSSHLVYNGTALLDERNIAGLEAIRNLTRTISTKVSADEEEDGVEFGRFFPHLTWVIRNHPGLDELTDERALSLASRDYLDSALRVSECK